MKQDILTSIFTRLRPALSAKAGSVLRGNEADVMDALQDAFCRLWRNRSEISDESHAKAASYVAVKSAAIDLLRRRREYVDPENLTETPCESESDSSSDLFDEINAIIECELSDRDRQVLLMRDRHGFEIDAIAYRLDISEANVRIILSRARKKVREIYLNRKTDRQ